MKKIPKHIEIVRSPIMSLSSMSLKSCNAISKLLSLHYESVGVTEVSTLRDLELLVDSQPDLVFIGLKFVPNDSGKKIWVNQYLEDNNIRHTGSSPEAIRLEQDKVAAKKRVHNYGYNTASYTAVSPGQGITSKTDHLQYPLFVKPTNMGAGKGIDEQSVVQNQDELEKKVKSLHSTYNTDVLIEEYLSGREFTIAVLKDEDTKNYTAMPIEMHPAIDNNGNKVISYALKSGPVETPVSYVSDESLRNTLSEFAIEVFESLGANNYGRIDVRLNAQNIPHFLEANLIPSLIEGSGNFLKACELNRSLDYETVILRIVKLGFGNQILEEAETSQHIQNLQPKLLMTS